MTPAVSPVLSYAVSGVCKSYPGPVTALRPMSLDIEAGQRVAVLGPSGSGKTTLLHILSGMLRPDSGEVLVEGKSLAGYVPGRQLSQLVGVIHQQYDLVPQLAAIHNVLAGRLGQWGLFRSLTSLVSPRDRRMARQAMERVGLGDKLYMRTSRLSGGEQQRVAIARLLVQNPRVILADEPVASLDPARADDLARLLSEISVENGTTLIASLHSLELARSYFTRVIGLRSGSLVFDLPVQGLEDALVLSLYDL